MRAFAALVIVAAVVAATGAACPPSPPLAFVSPTTPPPTVTEASPVPLALALALPGLGCAPASPCTFAIALDPPPPNATTPATTTTNNADTATVALLFPLGSAGVYNATGSVARAADVCGPTPPLSITVFPRPLPTASFAPNITTAGAAVTAAASFVSRGSLPAHYLWFVAPAASPAALTLVGSLPAWPSPTAATPITVPPTLLDGYPSAPTATPFRVYTLVRNAEGGESSLVPAPGTLVVHPEPTATLLLAACAATVGTNISLSLASLAHVAPYTLVYTLTRASDAATVASHTLSNIPSLAAANISIPATPAFLDPLAPSAPTTLIAAVLVTDASTLSATAPAAAQCSLTLAPPLALSLHPHLNVSTHAPDATPLLVDVVVGPGATYPLSLTLTVAAPPPTAAPPLFSSTITLAARPPSPLVIDVSAAAPGPGSFVAAAHTRDASGAVAAAVSHTLSLVAPVSLPPSALLFTPPHPHILTAGVPLTVASNASAPIAGGVAPLTLSAAFGPASPPPPPSAYTVVANGTAPSGRSFAPLHILPLASLLHLRVCDARGACATLPPRLVTVVPRPNVTLALSSTTFRPPGAHVSVTATATPVNGGVAPLTVVVGLAPLTPAPPSCAGSATCTLASSGAGCVFVNLTAALPPSCPPATVFALTATITDALGVSATHTHAHTLFRAHPPAATAAAWVGATPALLTPNANVAVNVTLAGGVGVVCATLRTIETPAAAAAAPVVGPLVTRCALPSTPYVIVPLVLVAVRAPGAANTTAAVHVVALADDGGTVAVTAVATANATVVAAPLAAVVAAPYPIATLGVPLSLTITNASGGVPPYTATGWTVDATPAVPGALLASTPTTAGVVAAGGDGAAAVAVAADVCDARGVCTHVALPAPGLTVVGPPAVSVLIVRPRTNASDAAVEWAWEGVRGGAGPGVALLPFVEMAAEGGWVPAPADVAVRVAPPSASLVGGTSVVSLPNAVGSFAVEVVGPSGTSNTTVWRFGVGATDANGVEGPVMWSDAVVVEAWDEPPPPPVAFVSGRTSDSAWPWWYVVVIACAVLLCCCCLLFVAWLVRRKRGASVDKAAAASSSAAYVSTRPVPAPVSPDADDGRPVAVGSGDAVERELVFAPVVAGSGTAAGSDESRSSSASASPRGAAARTVIVHADDVDVIPARLADRSVAVVVAGPAESSDSAGWQRALDTFGRELDAFLMGHPEVGGCAVRVLVPDDVDDDVIDGSALGAYGAAGEGSANVRVVKVSAAHADGVLPLTRVRMAAVAEGAEGRGVGRALVCARDAAGARRVEGTHAVAVEADSHWAADTGIEYVVSGVGSEGVLEAWLHDLRVIDDAAAAHAGRVRASASVAGEDVSRSGVGRATSSRPPPRVLFQIVTQQSITLRWAPDVRGGPYSAYRVYRGVTLAHEGPGVIFYDAGLEPDTVYAYVIVAKGGDGAWSEGSSVFRQRTRA